MTIDEMKKIADARNKAPWSLCIIPDTPSDELPERIAMNVDGRLLFATLPFFNREMEFIAMAANNWDYLMAVLDNLFDEIEKLKAEKHDLAEALEDQIE